MSSDRSSIPSLIIRLRKKNNKAKIILNNHSTLNHAIRAGKIKEVKLLLQKGVDINKPGRHTWTPLHMAAWGGRYKILNTLIENGASVTSTLSAASTRCGWTPLHLAVRKNQIKCAMLLLQNGASVNSIEDDVCHPLQIAVLNGSVEMVALLLDHGADIDLRFDQKDNFLQLFKSKTLCANFLAERKLPLLHISILKKCDKMTELLLNRGADIDMKTAMEETTLMQAVRVNDLKLVKLLLGRGANANDRDVYGIPVLFSIIINNNTLKSPYSKEEYGKMDIKLKIVHYLVRAGADVSVRFSTNNNYNDSLVSYAAQRGYYPIVKFLLFNTDFNSNAITLEAVSNVRIRPPLITPDIINDRNYFRRLNFSIQHAVNIILEYTVSRYVFGLPICQRFLYALLNNLPVSFYYTSQTQSIINKNLINKYSSMIDHMKKTKIGDTNITYWHLSTCGKNELIKLTDRKEIMDLYIPYCISNFHPYIYMLKKRVNIAYARRVWVGKLTEVIFKLYQKDLPYDCCEKIADLFNYNELKSVFYFDDKNTL